MVKTKLNCVPTSAKSITYSNRPRKWTCRWSAPSYGIHLWWRCRRTTSTTSSDNLPQISHPLSTSSHWFSSEQKKALECEQPLAIYRSVSTWKERCRLKKYFEYRTPANRQTYRPFYCKLGKLIAESRNSHFCSELVNASGNPRLLSRTVRRRLHPRSDSTW